MNKTLCAGLVMGAVLLALNGRASAAVPMNNYCVSPSFLSKLVKPNLLMMFDNSASMYDLAYPDLGNKDAGGTFTREPYYCYDQTYSSRNTYAGYFESAKYYQYNIANQYFVETGTFPASCTARVANQLCIDYDATAKTMSNFVASGNYLNWLSASKFDIQKQALTGGKYDGQNLVAESRGCVGNIFVKEANTADFVNYNSPETNNLNTSLGITFGIRGPLDAVNRSAPSPGGQTSIGVYLGNYNQGNCQEAVQSIISGGNADIKSDVASCLGATTKTTETKAKVAFQQSMQACWQLREGHAIGGDDINTVKNQCTDLYDEFATCSHNPSITCTANSDCGAGNTCIYGPPAIVPGDPALLCGREYEGQYYYYQGSTTSGTCTKDGAACTTNADCSPATYYQCTKTTNACTSDAQCPGNGNNCATNKPIANTCATSATSAGWKLIPGTTEADMIATHTQFCNDMTASPVTDPTDSPSDTALYENVPAILSGVGLEAQLNQPLTPTMQVRLHTTTEPTGLIHEFSDRMRIGTMEFNAYGSTTECSPTSTIKCPKVCSNDSSRACTTNIDCVSPGTCGAFDGNLDGGKVRSEIGKGTCSVTSTTVCAKDSHCPSSETCIANGVGSHSDAASLIGTIDAMRGATWTPFSEAFYNAIGYLARKSDGAGRTDLRLNATDFNANLNPVQYSCQQNFVLIVSDGMSTADQHSSVSNLASLYATAAASEAGTCPNYAGSKNLDNLAWLAANRKTGSFSTSAVTAAPSSADDSDFIRTFVVFNGTSSGGSGECDARTLLQQTAVKGNGLFYQAESSNIVTALRQAMNDMASRGASGTAASILSNSEGSGANILQAVFFPRKEYNNDTGSLVVPNTTYWAGEMQNLWYYLDPAIGNSTVREDTDDDRQLRLKSDLVAQFIFDGQATKVKLLQDTNGDGLGDANPTSFTARSSSPPLRPTSDPDANAVYVWPDDVKSLWRAGKLLWSRSASTRSIYTNKSDFTVGAATCSAPYPNNATSCTSGTNLMNFTASNLASPTTSGGASLATYLQSEGTGNFTGGNIVSYIRGTDPSGSCSVSTATSCSSDLDCPTGQSCNRWFRSRMVDIDGAGGGGKSEWKLGDIISSTPRLQSTSKVNAYDLPPPVGYYDASYTKFISTPEYKNRGMVYVGANDGMLHAFKLGKLNVDPLADKKAALEGANLGKEEWAFIPKNALPYLRYLMDSTYTDVNHLYLVDGTTNLVDASVAKPSSCTETNYWDCPKDLVAGTNWRTILLGGMGIGGASHSATATCTEGAAGDCVKAPVGQIGRSSYFALDVTNQTYQADGTIAQPPKLLWELSDADMATRGIRHATTGIAIVKISARTSGNPDYSKNGRWFAVFATGPSGPIDTGTRNFLGKSSQSLNVYVVDLAAASPLTLNTNYWVITTVYDGGSPTTLDNAFAGPMSGATIDTDRWNRTSAGFYQDDAIYFGYTQRIGNGTALDPYRWEGGGVLRLMTNEDLNPANWRLSKVIDGTGPVTSSVVKLQDRKYHNLWLYFGSGRYYYSQDDMSSVRYLYGVKEPCYLTSDDLDGTCVTKRAVSDLVPQNSSVSAVNADDGGWLIQLDGQVTDLGAERVITDPVALTNGAVFFTSFKPAADVCKFGGNSYLWGVRYDTGGVAPAAALQAKALVQVSTGSFEEVDLSTALSDRGDRRMGEPMVGKPPSDPPPIVSKSTLKPVKRILHIQER